MVVVRGAVRCTGCAVLYLAAKERASWVRGGLLRARALGGGVTLLVGFALER